MDASTTGWRGRLSLRTASIGVAGLPGERLECAIDSGDLTFAARGHLVRIARDRLPVRLSRVAGRHGVAPRALT